MVVEPWTVIESPVTAGPRVTVTMRDQRDDRKLPPKTLVFPKKAGKQVTQETMMATFISTILDVNWHQLKTTFLAGMV